MKVARMDYMSHKATVEGVSPGPKSISKMADEIQAYIVKGTFTPQEFPELIEAGLMPEAVNEWKKIYGNDYAKKAK